MWLRSYIYIYRQWRQTFCVVPREQPGPAPAAARASPPPSQVSTSTSTNPEPTPSHRTIRVRSSLITQCRCVYALQSTVISHTVLPSLPRDFRTRAQPQIWLPRRHHATLLLESGGSSFAALATYRHLPRREVLPRETCRSRRSGGPVSAQCPTSCSRALRVRKRWPPHRRRRDCSPPEIGRQRANGRTWKRTSGVSCQDCLCRSHFALILVALRRIGRP